MNNEHIVGVFYSVLNWAIEHKDLQLVNNLLTTEDSLLDNALVTKKIDSDGGLELYYHDELIHSVSKEIYKAVYLSMGICNYLDGLKLMEKLPNKLDIELNSMDLIGVMMYADKDTFKYIIDNCKYDKLNDEEVSYVVSNPATTIACIRNLKMINELPKELESMTPVIPGMKRRM